MRLCRCRLTLAHRRRAEQEETEEGEEDREEEEDKGEEEEDKEEEEELRSLDDRPTALKLTESLAQRTQPYTAMEVTYRTYSVQCAVCSDTITHCSHCTLYKPYSVQCAVCSDTLTHCTHCTLPTTITHTTQTTIFIQCVLLRLILVTSEYK